MWKPRWLLALPLAALVMSVSPGLAHASSVRDEARMFSAGAVQRAEAELNRLEREQGISTTVETVASLEGRPVGLVTKEHAGQSGSNGIYVLIAKAEHKIDVYASPRVSGAIDRARGLAIQDTFTNTLKAGDFDAALAAGVQEIGTEVTAAHARNGVRRQAGRQGVPAARGNQGSFGFGSLLGIGLVIVGVLFVVRLIGSLFAGRGQGYPGGRMGAPGYGPGGGGGGGFMSSLFGGIGGAMAGNWLYDQFSGRHQGGMTDSSSYGGDAGVSDAGTDATNVSGDWGGGDAGGGGDWGGGGGGGGGDWGGGGGDTGGGDW